jgi:hypothetical protein
VSTSRHAPGRYNKWIVDEIVSRLPCGTAFKVSDQDLFEDFIMPVYFELQVISPPTHDFVPVPEMAIRYEGKFTTYSMTSGSSLTHHYFHLMKLQVLTLTTT